MLKRIALAIALALFGTSALASTYTYTGGDFTSVSTTCTVAVGECPPVGFAGNRVILPLVTTELTNGTVGAPFGQGSITLTDGIVTNWSFYVLFPGVHWSTSMWSSPDGDGEYAYVFGATYYATYSASGPAGTWSSDAVSVIHNPIPATLPLFATGLGLIGLLAWRRRRG